MSNDPNRPVPIELRQPVTVAMAPPEVREWGPYQFPGLARLPDGRIQISFHVEADSATAYGLPPARSVSDDGGRTWRLLSREVPGGEDPGLAGGLLLPDGDRLAVKTLRSRSVSGVQLPAKPFAEGVTYGQAYAVYRVEDLPTECAAGWMQQRLPAGQTQWQEERGNVRLSGETRIVINGVMWFPWLFAQLLVAPDQSLWAVTYTIRRVVNGCFRQQYPVTILRSTDYGRTWDLWSEIPYAPDPAADPGSGQREGFTEPFVNIMPDGSILCLVRTTDGNGPGPLYVSRSTDAGRTWSPPAVFDTFGVWPQLLTLGNGVTLAAYGRPGLYVRATADPAGRHWDDRVTVIEPGPMYSDTCSYSALLPLDDHSALLAYSDFDLRDAAGRKCKGIQVREVRVTRGDEP